MHNNIYFLYFNPNNLSNKQNKMDLSFLLAQQNFKREFFNKFSKFLTFFYKYSNILLANRCWNLIVTLSSKIIHPPQLNNTHDRVLCFARRLISLQISQYFSLIGLNLTYQKLFRVCNFSHSIINWHLTADPCKIIVKITM